MVLSNQQTFFPHTNQHTFFPYTGSPRINKHTQHSTYLNSQTNPITHANTNYPLDTYNQETHYIPYTQNTTQHTKHRNRQHYPNPRESFIYRNIKQNQRQTNPFMSQINQYNIPRNTPRNRYNKHCKTRYTDEQQILNHYTQNPRNIHRTAFYRKNKFSKYEHTLGQHNFIQNIPFYQTHNPHSNQTQHYTDTDIYELINNNIVDEDSNFKSCSNNPSSYFTEQAGIDQNIVLDSQHQYNTESLDSYASKLKEQRPPAKPNPQDEYSYKKISFIDLEPQNYVNRQQYNYNQENDTGSSQQ